MSTEVNALEAALLQTTNLDEVVAKAEDLQGNKIDWSIHFFEPQPGCDYTIKFVTNIEGSPIVHRQVYKDLPDPQRKGKRFRYVSDGNPKTCEVLKLFFDLNNLKKEGDIEAERKIKEYLGKSNQGACIVQILASPKQEDINKFRILVFSTYGENATIANMLSKKLNPSEAARKSGVKPVDIFNTFGSPALLLSCRETQIADIGKGRGYSGSEWLDSKKYGCIVELNGEQHEFSDADTVKDEKGKVIGVKEEVKPFFAKLIEELKNPDISIHNYFEYTTPGDPRNSKECEEHITNVFEKIKEIVPILKEKDMAFIANYGKADTSAPADSAKTIGDKSAADILKESAPTELVGSILNGGAAPAPTAQASSTTTTSGNADGDLADILKS